MNRREMVAERDKHLHAAEVRAEQGSALAWVTKGILHALLALYYQQELNDDN